MEMMVVLLIVAIVAAASAPMVTKKLSRNAGTGDSPWVFTGLNNSIAYNMRGDNNSPVIIGASRVPNSIEGATRLYIDSGNADSHIAFGNGNDTPLLLTADPALGRIGFSNKNIPERTIAFGSDQSGLKHSSVVIGNYAYTDSSQSVAIGSHSENYNNGNRLIQRDAHTNHVYTRTEGVGSTAIGAGCVAGSSHNENASGGERGDYATAIGIDSYAPAHGAIAIGAQANAMNNYSVAIGASSGYSVGASGVVTDSTRYKGLSSVSIGASARALAQQSVALGNDARIVPEGTNSIAIGHSAQAGGGGYKNSSNASFYGHQVAIGNDAYANDYAAIAIGHEAHVAVDVNNGDFGIAIGHATRVNHNHSAAIGADAFTTAPNQIVLGTSNDTVYIPGKLIVGQQCFLGANLSGGDLAVAGQWGNNQRRYIADYSDEPFFDVWVKDSNAGAGYEGAAQFISDRRLKNVGKSYTAGLEELKKLDFFHYTFKKDEAKTPRVGVMAQDLQKVFPNAVTKGEDGYLRIRLEDMFYAVINAVKELDAKVASIVENITGMKTTISEQQKTIDAQQVIIEELQKQNAEFEKRLKKLEKRN